MGCKTILTGQFYIVPFLPTIECNITIAFFCILLPLNDLAIRLVKIFIININTPENESAVLKGKATNRFIG
jgi:hypothetical protein